MKRAYLFVLLGILTSTLPLRAADADFTASALVGVLSGFGYQNPYSEFNAEGQGALSGFVFQGQGAFSPTHKYNGSGHVWIARGTVLRSITKNFSAGAGIAYSRTVTDDWQKEATRPAIAVQFRAQGVQLDARYLFGQLDQHNHLHGVQVELWKQIRGGLGLRIDYELAGFEGSDLPSEHHVGVGIMAGPSWRF